jgi:hypothetical protein
VLGSECNTFSGTAIGAMRLIPMGGKLCSAGPDAAVLRPGDGEGAAVGVGTALIEGMSDAAPSMVLAEDVEEVEAAPAPTSSLVLLLLVGVGVVPLGSTTMWERIAAESPGVCRSVWAADSCRGEVAAGGCRKGAGVALVLANVLSASARDITCSSSWKRRKQEGSSGCLPGALTHRRTSQRSHFQSVWRPLAFALKRPSGICTRLWR